MKPTFVFLSLFAFLSSVIAQPGFEGLIIEPYYVADANDASSPNFPVPAGSITYRVYVDMAQSWQLQAIFGATNSLSGEIDTLVIRSTQPFFNNEDKGQIFGYQISTNNIDENTVLLDSWFSTGRSSNNTFGVLKPEDTNGSAPAFPNLNGLLQNNDPLAGIPINVADGNISGTSTSTWSLIGISMADLELFDNVNLAGQELIINEGSMTSFIPPLMGPNASNKVLIGQFTTVGSFSGQLNVQIRNVATGEVQQWVAETPGLTQFTSPSLRWRYNLSPSVMITTPLDGSEFPFGQSVMIAAHASDSDGEITLVEFYFNGQSIGTDDTYPYEISHAFEADGFITAVATDIEGAESISTPVHVTINPYLVRNVIQLCNPDNVCIPIEVVGQGVSSVTGYDIVLTFDNTMIIPTGVIRKSNDLMLPFYFTTDYTIDLINQQMLISVFLNATAPSGTTFSGIGDLICAEFVKRPAFHAVDTTFIAMPSIQETFQNGDIVQRYSTPPGVFTTQRNTSFLGSVAFWADTSPIKYDTAHPSDYLHMEIQSMNADCDTAVFLPLHPDLDGAFIHDLNQGEYLSFSRDISTTADVQSVINSFDAFLGRKVLLDDLGFTPTIFQLMALDVNMDGVISSGDISQINQRSVLMQAEFKQAWNYDGNGTPSIDYALSKDWLFVSHTTVEFDPGYTKSSTYPQDDGIGFSKYRVPTPPFCLWTGIPNLPDTCPEVGIETYFGVLLGDVNGNYRFIEHDGILK